MSTSLKKRFRKYCQWMRDVYASCANVQEFNAKIKSPINKKRLLSSDRISVSGLNAEHLFCVQIYFDSNKLITLTWWLHVLISNGPPGSLSINCATINKLSKMWLFIFIYSMNIINIFTNDKARIYITACKKKNKDEYFSILFV